MRIIRYWGSHFKTLRQTRIIAGEFQPMVERGWECSLVVEREPEDPSWTEALRSIGVRLLLQPRPTRKFDLKCISRVAKLCRDLRPDVFICENIHDSPLIGAALSRVPVRIWIKRSMNSDFERGDRPNLRNRLAPTTRLSCALATRVFAVSRTVCDELVGLGVASEKVLIRPDPRRSEGSNVATKEDVRRSLGISGSGVVWTSIGRAVPVKGWDMLIRAFHRVAGCDPRAELLLVGGLDRPEERATAALLRSEIERLGLQGKVRLTGNVEDVASLLSASDAFVMSSHSEGFSLALIEAMEAGLPCVATRVGIATDVIHHGINGMLVDRFNEERMAEALTEITCVDSLRMRLANNARVPDMIPTLQAYAQRMADDVVTLRFNMKSSGSLQAIEQLP